MSQAEPFVFRLHPRREKPVTPKESDIQKSQARREIERQRERLAWIKEWGHSDEWDDNFHH